MSSCRRQETETARKCRTRSKRSRVFAKWTREKVANERFVHRMQSAPISATTQVAAQSNNSRAARSRAVSPNATVMLSSRVQFMIIDNINACNQGDEMQSSHFCSSRRTCGSRTIVHYSRPQRFHVVRGGLGVFHQGNAADTAVYAKVPHAHWLAPNAVPGGK